MQSRLKFRKCWSRERGVNGDRGGKSRNAGREKGGEIWEWLWVQSVRREQGCKPN